MSQQTCDTAVLEAPGTATVAATTETAPPPPPAPPASTSVPAPGSGADLDFFGNIPCWTPEIELACQQVSHWVRCDLPGGMIFGLQRIGKTWCSRYIQQSVPTILGSSTVAWLWSTQQPLHKSEIELYRGWLAQSGSRAYNHSRVGVLRERLTDHLLESAEATGATRIVLIIDEAHWLYEDYYPLLMALANNLALRGKRPFVLLVGHPELRQVGKNFSSMKNGLQILGRYFSVEHEYKAIELATLDKLLDAMDETGGQTVVERYLPELAAQGWQLSDAAEPLRIAITSLAAAKDVTTQVRLPMQYARAALNSLLYRLRDDPEQRKSIDSKLLAACLREVGFGEMIRHYSERPLAVAT